MSSFYSVLTNQSQDIQEDTLINDIQTHLSALLNARQFMVSTDHDYGLPDLCSDITMNYPTKVIEATRELIHRYEPRLKIRHIACENDNKIYNQINLRVIASVSDSNLIELRAQLGAQQLSAVTIV